MEIEAKFLANQELLERLACADSVAGWPVVQRDRLRLETVYYDTEDRRLAAGECALRLRKGGPEGTLLSFKRGSVAGEISHREEIEVAVPADYDPADPETRPRPKLKAEEVAAGRPLGPILTLRMERTVLQLAAVDSRLQVCLDSTSRPDVPVWQDHEIEVELEAGPETRLAEFVAALQSEHELVPSESSKIQRAIRMSIG